MTMYWKLFSVQYLLKSLLESLREHRWVSRIRPATRITSSESYV